MKKIRRWGILFCITVLLAMCQMISVSAEETQGKEVSTINIPEQVIVTDEPDGIFVKDYLEIETTGSSGEITFTYYNDSNGFEEHIYNDRFQWAGICDPGVYYVMASVAEDDNYQSATSKICKFIIVPEKRSFFRNYYTKQSDGFTYIKLDWDTEVYGNGYVLYRRELGGEEKQIAVIKNKQTWEYVDKEALDGVLYIYRIAAYVKDAAGNIFLGESRETSKAICCMQFAVESKPKCVLMAWSAAKDAKGYQIYRKIQGVKGWKLVKTIKNPKKLFWKDKDAKALRNGKRAEYYVKAIYADADKKLGRGVSETIIYLNRPNVRRVGTSLSWDKNKKANGYVIISYNKKTKKFIYKATTNTTMKNVFKNKNIQYAYVYGYREYRGQVYLSVLSKKIKRS